MVMQTIQGITIISPLIEIIVFSLPLSSQIWEEYILAGKRGRALPPKQMLDAILIWKPP